jgi:hypothetical protein
LPKAPPEHRRAVPIAHNVSFSGIYLFPRRAQLARFEGIPVSTDGQSNAINRAKMKMTTVITRRFGLEVDARPMLFQVNWIRAAANG